MDMLRISGLCKRFGEKEVLRGLDLTVPEKSIFGFVGRNGGNKFLAIFEESCREDIDRFLSRVESKVRNYNEKNPEHPVEYAYGVAFDEPQKLKINELVALSNNRIRHN